MHLEHREDTMDLGKADRVAEFAHLIDLAERVHADPASIGVLSTGEQCAVALLLGRLDLWPKATGIPSTRPRPWGQVGKPSARPSSSSAGLATGRVESLSNLGMHLLLRDGETACSSLDAVSRELQRGTDGLCRST